MKFYRLFQPVKINSVELRNRIVMPPMVTNFGYADNTVSGRLVAYHAARAKGGFGLNIVENFAVHPLGKAFSAVLGLWDDRFIPGCRGLTEAVHRHGGKIFAQIYHAGAQTTENVIGVQPVAPSAVPHPVMGTLPRQLNVEEIEEIVESFGRAARRAREAGFDGVEVHGSHGYLVSEFMSAYTNRRTDEYGGDLLGRMRFPVEIIRSIRRHAGRDYPVTIRIAGDERVSDGRTIEETRVAARLLEEAGYDALHVTTATTATMHYIAPPYYLPPALNVEYAEKIKKCVSIPVITTGCIYDPHFAESILAEGRADLVGMGRASIADPELPCKVAAGLLEDIRPCTGCLQGCIGSLYYGRPITCMANPEVGREEEAVLKPALQAKKVLVVGGGPAGLEAARVAARRGHKVILCEKSGSLGGQLKIAAMPPHKQRMAHLVKYLVNQVKKAGVEIRLATEVDLKLVREISPDTVVVATGGEPFIPAIPGAEGKNVVSAWDVLGGRAGVGGKVLVIGGGSVGCETADFLAVQGKAVDLVEKLDKVGHDMVERVRYFLMQRLLSAKVGIYTEANVLEITGDGVKVERRGVMQELSGYDSIVLALGTRPVNSLVEELSKSKVNYVVIGDAKKPGNALEAIGQAAEAGRAI
ncbi:MAG: FAD-dependent oxidoreductase [Pelotomaculum sp.]|uniref:NADH:flavin oxidoreductases n=1 Tax=Pelotomaculum thermopropionicum (strain DSM 13744 / JCM 10971 / SI) TaxID=370438 RepID=A5D5M6_PELTS|nr:FAD-dependent oxidoreductase [Pelotomaculum sp.]BAF58448.1 hypothetical protein PTH_0267 [Pelotomaculum thermopropionicum SI]